MTTSRRYASSAVINSHQFLVIGSRNDRGDSFSSSEYYDTTIRIWNLLPVNLPYALNSNGTAFIGDLVVVIGGITRQRDNLHGEAIVTVRAQVFVLRVPGGDLSVITAGQYWEPLAPMRQARSSFGCASDGRFVYVFGGRDGNNMCLATAECFDTETNEWRQLPDIPGDGRSHCVAGLVGNKLILLGGTDDRDSGVSRPLLAFDTIQQKWQYASAEILHHLIQS